MEIKEGVENWQLACDTDELEGEEMLECRAGERDILLVRTDAGMVACPALCPHMDEPLSHGFAEGNVLTCSKHLWQWDLQTGAPIGLAEEGIPVAPVRIEDGKVFVNLALLDCDAGRCR